MSEKDVQSDTAPSEREGRTLDFSGKPSAFVSPSMLAEAIRRGWQIDPQRKQEYFDALDKAVRDLPTIQDGAKRVMSTAVCLRVLELEQAAALRDLHHTERMQHEDGVLDLRMKRAEEGKPNDSLLVQVAAVERLPEPDWLTKRRKLLEPGAS